MSADKKLAIGLFCSDWRLHQGGVRVSEAVKDLLQVDGVDLIVMPGPDGLAAGSEGERAAMVSWFKVLIDAHKPTALAFVAHYTCAGHPVADAEHDRDIEATMRAFKEALGYAGEMVALCATHESDESWPLKEIARIPASA